MEGENNQEEETPRKPLIFSRPTMPVYYCKLKKRPTYVAHERMCRLRCLYISEWPDLPFEEAISKCEKATTDHKEWHTEVYTEILEQESRAEKEREEERTQIEKNKLIEEILKREPVYIPVEEKVVVEESDGRSLLYTPESIGPDLDIDESRYVEAEFGVKILMQINRIIYKADLDNFIRYFQTKESVGYLQTDFNEDGTEFILKFTKDSKYQSKAYKIISRKENDVILEEIIEVPEPLKEHLYTKDEKHKGEIIEEK